MLALIGPAMTQQSVGKTSRPLKVMLLHNLIKPTGAEPDATKAVEASAASASDKPAEASVATDAIAAPSEPGAAPEHTPAIQAETADAPVAAEADSSTLHTSSPGEAKTPEPLTEIDEVDRALEEGGFRVSRCNLDDDIDRLGHAVVVVRPDLIVNLVDEMWDDATQHVGVAQLCDLYGYPTVGSDPLTLATCQERSRVRLILADAEVTGPGFGIVRDINSIPDTSGLSFPLVVTQAFDDTYELEGLGHAITTREELEERVAELAAEYELPLLIEEFLSGRRLQIIVIGNRSLQLLPLTETPQDAAVPGEDATVAQLDLEHAQRARELARTAFRAMGCRDVAQVDFCLTDDGNLYVIDVRPAFDMGDGSPFQVAATATDGGYTSAVSRVVSATVERTGISTSTPEAPPKAPADAGQASVAASSNNEG